MVEDEEDQVFLTQHALARANLVNPVRIVSDGKEAIDYLAGKNAFAGGAAYNASKFGLNGFSEAMMLDHRNEGIRVATIMPGSVDTDFGGKTPPAAGELTKSGSQSGNTEAERLKNAWKIQPEDVAEIVMMLLKMPRRTTISQIEVRPSRPPGK